MQNDRAEKSGLGLLDEILQGKRLEKYIPLIGWITNYQRAWLRDDLVSGVVVGAIMVPVNPDFGVAEAGFVMRAEFMGAESPFFRLHGRTRKGCPVPPEDPVANNCGPFA